MNELKIKAVKLRKAGYSYAMIGQRLNVSKSTLSNWLNDIKFFPNKELVKRVGRAKLKSALFRQKIKLADIKKGKMDGIKNIGILSDRDLLILGIGLYLGEGSKAFEQVRIINSDPDIIRIAIKWFKDYFNLDIKNFKITLHDYPDNDIKNNKIFWSKYTQIPIEQFSESVLDRRINKSSINKRKLPHGTAQLYIKKGDTDLTGVKSLHRKIMGLIEAVTKQV
ncbi:MAG: helix-turn-helix domain containing protein [Candidatus Portnoybacteria bacterium]|nr:helix-turn-helix domain containing protein [Candidatus Portnoybacteria bacterium]MDD4982759.1 helix-turn-helix domain containing protein [Candidatus Portnoybacteria bacterium]